jgi:hypothetical protein
MWNSSVVIADDSDLLWYRRRVAEGVFLDISKDRRSFRATTIVRNVANQSPSDAASQSSLRWTGEINAAALGQ